MIGLSGWNSGRNTFAKEASLGFAGCVEAVQNLWAMRLIMYFAILLGGLYAAGKRTALRERFGIAGAIFDLSLQASLRILDVVAVIIVRKDTWLGSDYTGRVDFTPNLVDANRKRAIDFS